MNFQQQPHTLMMIRPKAFGFNAQTAASNVFQNDIDVNNAHEEFERMVDTLRAHEVPVIVIDDTRNPKKPDAIFPNNWISFHQDRKIVVYPMMAQNRRLERRANIVDMMKLQFDVSEVIDISHNEEEGQYLEGTGSIVFDHVNRIAYASRSPRTNEAVLRMLCDRLNYKPFIFDAFDDDGKAIYHTNVLMSIGEKFAILCLDAITSDEQQEEILQSLSQTGHKVIAISFEQMSAFAGNTIEIRSSAGENILLISQTAFNSLLPGQVNAITKFVDLLPISITSIEKIGGGSVRCMVAGIHLPKRK